MPSGSPSPTVIERELASSVTLEQAARTRAASVPAMSRDDVVVTRDIGSSPCEADECRGFLAARAQTYVFWPVPRDPL